MQLHKHTVTWACMQFPELACSYMSLHAVPFFVWAAHKNFAVLVITDMYHVPWPGLFTEDGLALAVCAGAGAVWAGPWARPPPDLATDLGGLASPELPQHRHGDCGQGEGPHGQPRQHQELRRQGRDHRPHQGGVCLPQTLYSVQNK